ncbi:odorant receptor 13a-like [Odontomachus brunneus]|uniref:odorant receptor 13a-like n=1 Tax=Odontomachus brunneus TaxID=486640 RepID=UPI0013F1DF16|nr:odorant receptor 13a-like [Odontomachus brunneus]
MHRSSGYNDFEWAINLNRFMLKVVGLWPLDNRDSRQIVKLKFQRLCCFIIILFVVAIPSLISLIRVWGDMILMIDNMQYCLPLSMIVLKICIIWYKQEVLGLLIDMVEEDWVKVKMKEERNIMLKCARIARTIAVCGMFMAFFGIISLYGLPFFKITKSCVTNLTDFEKHFPIPSYYLHDVTKSPQFELTLLAQAFASSIGSMSYSAVDNLFGLLAFHVCGQLENLHLRLKHMKKYRNYDEVLKYNVQDHIRLIRSIKIIDDIFNLMLLGLLLYFAILFCLQGFLIVNVIKQKDQLSVSQLVWFVVATVSFLLHMCLYCAVGEILVIQVSERIGYINFNG